MVSAQKKAQPEEHATLAEQASTLYNYLVENHYVLKGRKGYTVTKLLLRRIAKGDNQVTVEEATALEQFGHNTDNASLSVVPESGINFPIQGKLLEICDGLEIVRVREGRAK